MARRRKRVRSNAVRVRNKGMHKKGRKLVKKGQHLIVNSLNVSSRVKKRAHTAIQRAR